MYDKWIGEIILNKYIELTDAFPMSVSTAMRYVRFQVANGLDLSSYHGFSFADNFTFKRVEIPFSGLNKQEKVFLGIPLEGEEDGFIPYERVDVLELIRREGD